jgi:hypothetical protein
MSTRRKVDGRTAGHHFTGASIMADQKFETEILTNPELDTTGGNFTHKVLTGVSQAYKIRDNSKSQDIIDINTDTDVIRVFKEYKAVGFDTTAVAKSADYTAENGDFVLVTTGASVITITLPEASLNQDAIIEIKKVDAGAGTVTIDGNASETIDGSLTQPLNTQYDFMKLHCDGSNWHIKG